VGAAIDDGDVGGDEATALGGRQAQVHIDGGIEDAGDFVLIGEAPGSFGFGQVAAGAEGEVADEGARLGGRREDVHVGELLAEAVGALDADQAAHEVDDEVGAALLDWGEAGEAAVGLVFGALADDASVEDDHIGLLDVGLGAIAESLEGAGDALGVSDVHLAAFGPDVVLHGANSTIGI
jgi:hypothetical protein